MLATEGMSLGAAGVSFEPSSSLWQIMFTLSSSSLEPKLGAVKFRTKWDKRYFVKKIWVEGYINIPGSGRPARSSAGAPQARKLKTN